jgi:hypothetical protein
MKPSLRLHFGECRLEVREIGAQRLLADIGDRAREHRRPAAKRTRGAKARRVQLAVELGKFEPIPSPGECGETARVAGLPATEASHA